MAADWGKTPCFTHNCSKCCRETEMPLTKADIKLIENEGYDSELFTITLDDNSVRLANSPETRACVFLETNSSDLHAPGICKVWDVRPEGCRIYPLVLDEDENSFLDDLCPHRDEFPTPPIGLQGRLLVLAQTIDDEVN